jgi:hypothetical protein
MKIVAALKGLNKEAKKNNGYTYLALFSGVNRKIIASAISHTLAGVSPDGIFYT